MLKEINMRPLTARELKPEGWLRQQLEIQARGLSGHLDQIWPDVRDSAWLGGDRDGWEPVSYTHLDVYKRQNWWIGPADLRGTCCWRR